MAPTIPRLQGEAFAAVRPPRLGPSYLGRLGGGYIGTIHAYAFHLLQTDLPRYETYEIGVS